MTGFLCGAAQVALWPALPGPVPTLWSGLCACVLVALLRRFRRAPVGFLCGLLGGCALAVLQGHYLLAGRLPADCHRQQATVEGTVVSLPDIGVTDGGESRQRFLLQPHRVAPPRCAGPRRMQLTLYGGEPVQPGQRYSLEVTLRYPSASLNPVGFDREAFYAREDIGAVGVVRRMLDAAPRQGLWRTLTDYQRLRMRLRSRINGLGASDPGSPGLGRDARGVLRALTLGDRSGIDDALWHLCRQLGIGHLLVISGLHIGLVAGAGFVSCSLLLRLLPGLRTASPWLPVLAALGPAAFYAVLAGLTLPTRRALVMLGAFCLALLLGRRGDAPTSLLLAATVVLLGNALAVLGSGFWLSFGAVACLLWLANWQAGQGRLRSALATHLGMSLAMLALTAWFFGGGSLVSAVANLLLIPLVGLVAVPLCLLAALCSLAGLAVGDALWLAAGRPIEWALPAMMLLADEVGSWIYRPLSTTLPGMLLALSGAALLLAPLGWRLRTLAMLLLLPLLLPPLPAAVERGGLRLAVLDVGQGTAVLLDDGRRALLYDTGGGVPGGFTVAEAVLLPYLRSRGFTSLDSFVVSHGDLDHSAGAGAVLAAVPVGRFRHGVPGGFGGRGRRCVAGEAWQWPGGTRFQFLSPAVEQRLSSNNGSCVLQVDTGYARVLLTGDIDSSRERDLVRFWRRRLGSDWLLVAHHGSASSTATSLLKWVRAGTAVISAGRGNRFGHPHPQVVDRLAGAGAQVESTATGGALLFELHPQGADIDRWRQRAARYWRY